MKGFMKDKKFHPIKSYQKVRKSKDQKAKSIGVRLQRNFVPAPPSTLVEFAPLKTLPKETQNSLQTKNALDELQKRFEADDLFFVTTRKGNRLRVLGDRDMIKQKSRNLKNSDNIGVQTIPRKKREPFPVGKKKGELGDADVIEALGGKATTQADLIAMQRAPRKKGDLTEEDFKRRQEIVRKLNDAKFQRDKVAKRKIDATDERQFKKKSLALGRANDKLAVQKKKFKKEFGVDVIDID